jgi:hypothetical protein
MLPRTRKADRSYTTIRGGSGHVLRRRLLLPHLRESRLVAGIFDALLVLLPRAAVRGGGRRKEGGEEGDEEGEEHGEEEGEEGEEGEGEKDEEGPELAYFRILPPYAFAPIVF